MLYERAKAHFARGDAEAAEATFTALLSRTRAGAPSGARTLANRAACRLRLGKLAECEDDCTAALELSMRNLRAGIGDNALADRMRLKLYVRRAEARRRRADFKGAAEDARAARKAASADDTGVRRHVSEQEREGVERMTHRMAVEAVAHMKKK